MKNIGAITLIDEKDKLILEELEKDARTPTKKIANILNIPRITVHTRIEKMKQEGIIQKFTIVTDSKKIGLPVTAFVFVEYSPKDDVPQQMLAEKIARIKNVYEVHLISGEWDILVKIKGESLENLAKIVLDEIRPMKGVGKTVTCASFLSIKNNI